MNKQYHHGEAGSNGNGRAGASGFNTLVVIREFVACWMRHLGCAEITLWLAIWQHANYGTGHPGTTRLKEMMGLTGIAHVRIARRKLAQLGLIIIKSRGGGDSITEYEIPSQLPPAPQTDTGIEKEPGIRNRSEPGSENDPHRGPKNAVPGSKTERALLRKNNPEEPIEEPNRRTHCVSDDDCESIYREYPKKKSPGDAYRAIRKAVPFIAKRGEADPIGWLKSKVKAYAAARRQICDADPSQKQYTPHPASWINARGYDEPETEWEQDAAADNGRRHRIDEIAKRVTADPNQRAKLDTRKIRDLSESPRAAVINHPMPQAVLQA